MGVPSFFAYMLQNFPEFVTKLGDQFSMNGKKVVIDNFFIDGNSIIHESAQKIFNYGTFKKDEDEFEDFSFDQKLLKVYEAVWRKIKHLQKFVAPTKMLYIAFDGVPPLAKMIQQRQRRYLAVHPSFVQSSTSRTDSDGSEKSLEKSSSSFDSNCISVGTEFMQTLRKYLEHKLIRNEFPVKTIFSSAAVKGEGEHKIMDHIRKHNLTEANCLYGVDGDLPMLAIASECKSFYILREDKDCHLLNCTKIKLAFVKKLNESIDIEEVDEQINEQINGLAKDFVFMCFFAGNDFLPKLQMFTLLKDAIDLMINTHKVLFKGRRALTRDDGINGENLISFVEYLYGLEKKCLERQINFETKDLDLENWTLLACAEKRRKFTKYRKDTWVLNLFSYKKLYNSKIIKYSMSLKQHQRVCDVVKEYLKGLHWVYIYYVSGCPSWDWFYPYYYAPLMLDLLDHFYDAEITFKDTMKINPLGQLSIILPPQSVNIVPAIDDFTEVDFTEVGFTEFSVDYEGKKKQHMGIPLLPRPDFEKATKFSELDTPLNESKPVVRFVFKSKAKDSKTKKGKMVKYED